MFNFLDTPRVGIWRVSSEFREGRAHLYQEWSGKCSLQRNLDFEAKKKKKNSSVRARGGIERLKNGTGDTFMEIEQHRVYLRNNGQPSRGPLR